MPHHFKLIASVYDNISHLYSNAFLKAAEHLEEFLDLVSPGGRILDVGCGPGLDAEFMASKGYGVMGIDASEAMIRLASERNPEMEFRLADMRHLDFKPASFDGIFASFSLIHIPKKDTEKTILDLYRLLKPNGVIYFSIQEGRSQEVFATSPLHPEEIMFLNILSASEMRGLLQRSDLFILREFQRKPKKGEHPFQKFFFIARTGSQNPLQ